MSPVYQMILEVLVMHVYIRPATPRLYATEDAVLDINKALNHLSKIKFA